MRSQPFRCTRVAAAAGGAVLALGAGHAFGAAFALQEQNASGLGHAYAGGAAAAEDVTTHGIWTMIRCTCAEMPSPSGGQA